MNKRKFRLYGRTREWIAAVVAYLVVTAMIVAGLYLYVTVYSIPQCREFGAGWGLPSRWTALTGCRLEVEPGRWIPIYNYRYFGEDTR